MSTYKHLLTGGDDFLLRFPLEAVDDVLACVSGTLQPRGQLPAGLVRIILQVLVTQRVTRQGDGPVEQTLGQGRHGHQGHGGCSRVLAKDGHLLWISSKLADVLLDPLQDHHLVQQSLVAASRLV